MKSGFAISIIVSLMLQVPCFGEQSKTILTLPQPNMQKGMPLMKALAQRHSDRAFSTKDISMQTLSELLWAAYGINRKDSGKRTAPSAMNWQEIDIYAAMQDGVYRYDPKTHSLVLIASQDIRKNTGTQDFPAIVPVDLIYVADYAKMEEGKKDEWNARWASLDTGFIGQNVYLYCASAGLATVFVASVNKEPLAKLLRLSPLQEIIAVQPVGYPEK